MRNLLSLVGLVVVVFLGLGWYLGWYQFAIGSGDNGNTKVTFDVNTNKIKDDSQKGLNRAGEFIDGLKKEPADGKKDFVGPTLPGDWTAPSTSKTTPSTR